MPKFSSIAKGIRARKVVTFPLMRGGEATCALVPLLTADEVDILSEARAYAVKKGVAEPKEGDPIYELAIWIHTLVRACVDVDSPEDAPAPFFDGGAAQILHPTEGLDRDRVALLFQLQSAWQDENSPSPGKMKPDEYLAHIWTHALAKEGEDLPFFSWRHGMQQTFLVFMARQLVALHELSLPPSPSSEDTSKNSTSSGPLSS